MQNSPRTSTMSAGQRPLGSGGAPGNRPPPTTGGSSASAEGTYRSSGGGVGTLGTGIFSGGRRLDSSASVREQAARESPISAAATERPDMPRSSPAYLPR